MGALKMWVFSEVSFKPAVTGYCRTKTYPKNDLRHTRHVLREKTSRPLAGLVDFLSTMGESEEEIREAIKRMHAQEKTKFKPAKNAYLEVLCYPKDYPESKKDLIAYMRKLEQRFNTRVYTVVHLDESMPHAHMIIRWRDNEGKCLRLQKRDLWQLWEDTIREVNARAVLRELARKSVDALLYAIRKKDNKRFLEIHNYVRKYRDAYNRFCELYLEAVKRGISFDRVFSRSPLRVGRRKALWLFEHVLRKNLSLEEVFPKGFLALFKEKVLELKRAIREVQAMRQSYYRKKGKGYVSSPPSAVQTPSGFYQPAKKGPYPLGRQKPRETARSPTGFPSPERPESIDPDKPDRGFGPSFGPFFSPSP